AWRRGAISFGLDVRRTPSASPSECAGSVDTASTRAPRRASATARAAAHVVLPTPPLPPKNAKCGGDGSWRRRSVFVDVVGNRGFDAGDLRAGGHREGARLGALDLADACDHVAFNLGELLIGDLAELELHLGFEELLAERGVVLRFGLGGRDDL